ncbi:MAG: DUF1456 domain-containing protein [Spirochaetes bacterium]|nr:MAG: DUF1456 domain-containing protein [Spirochaetota bacterium]
MTNNDILKKLRIALNLQEEDIMEILSYVDFKLSHSELRALFRNPEHRNYKECGDQILRKFLDGLIIKNRGRRKKKKVLVPKNSPFYKKEDSGRKG